MDKNTIIGFVLIAAVLIGFSYLNRPTEEEIARRKAYNDSIALVQEAKQLTQQKAAEQDIHDGLPQQEDSLASEQYALSLGDFKSAAYGKEEHFTLENDLVEITLSNKGARVISAKLKHHMGQDSLPVELFNQEESNFNLTFALRNNHIINTSSIFFNTTSDVLVDDKGNQQLVFRLDSEEDAKLDFVYTLPADDYILDLVIK